MPADPFESASRSASAATPEPSVGHNGNGAAHAAPQEAVQRLGRLIGELREYFTYFLTAKVDSAKSSVRRAVLLAAIGVIGLIAGVALISTAAVLLLVGLAWGLGLLLGHQLWLGAFLVGLILLGGIGLGAYLMLRRNNRSSRKSMVQKYEHRQQWERNRFGRSVTEQAAASGGQ